MSLHHMLRAAAGRNTPAPPASNDPQFNYVALLLHGDGTNGAQNNTFIDSSSNNFTITRNGNTTQGSLSPYGNLWSNYFDGAGDYLNLTLSAATGSTFTAEAWVYLTANPSAGGSAGVVSTTNTATSPEGWFLRVLDDGRVSFAETWGANQILSTATVALNTWTHIAGVRNGSGTGNASIFVNGVLQASTGTFNKTYTSTSLVIGRAYTSNNIEYLTGYISNVRVTSTAVYTATFTPPTAPLTAISGTSLLTCQSNRFRDNSTNNFTITRNGDVRVTKDSPFLPTAAYSTSTIGGSGYFDGTDDWLTVSNNTAFDFGSGNFTVEGWIYINTNAALDPDSIRQTNICACMFDNTPASGWHFSVTGNSTTTGTGLMFDVWNSGSRTSFSASSTIPQNTWNHVAVVRNGSSLSLYLNGASILSTTISVSVNSGGNNFDIGSLQQGTAPKYYWYFPGYISNLRVVKGTAVYTAAFTPPTSPLTAITNTSLLLNFTNAGIFDNAAENNLETVGNAQISTSVKKYGTGSLAFDGNGDGLVAAGLSPTLVNYDFTWECWVNFSSLSGGPCLINVGTSSTNRTLLYFDATNGIRYAVDRSGVSQVSIQQGSTTGWSTGVWYHVALVRSGNTYTIYRDGISVASGTSTYVQSIFATGFNIGFSNTSPFFLYFNGYIDDVRITNGYARYTANFTPPTAAFPDQ